MSCSDHPTSVLTDTLETGARQIDSTFAEAGERLGAGLPLFDSLKERFSTLSRELTGEDFGRARATLGGLASDLRRLGQNLSGEIGKLQDLATHDAVVSQALERLIRQMRLIMILTRGARIEAVSIASTGSDFGAFTGEILTLTTEAQRTVEACARDHDRLSALLRSALGMQRDFERRYGCALSVLAEKLELTLAAVAVRQQKSAALTSDAAAHSGRIAMATGGAIVALQSGDSIRQRLEHAIAGLRLVDAIAEGTGPGAGLGDEAKRACRFVLHRLQSGQLRDIAATLTGDADTIETALALLAGDTTKLIDLMCAFYGGQGTEPASFLGNLEAELAEASELLGKCDTARAGVDQVTDALSGVLDTCQRTVPILSKAVSDIVLIGMNAGLRAARIGGGGRSLVVIAQELKQAADAIAADTRRLTPIFDQMQAVSGEFKRCDRLDAARFAALERAMRSSLASIRGTGERLGATLDWLAQESDGFCAVIAQARLSFSNVGATGDLIASAADQLARSAAQEPGPDADAFGCVRDILQEHVWSSYTMAAERTIHRTIMAECGIDQEAAQPQPHQPDAALDEFIF